MILKYLIQKEFLQIRRNAFLPKLIFIFPIIITCIMPWVMNMEVKNIVVDVVDNDRTPESKHLVHAIEMSNYFIFHGQKASYADALHDIEESRADIILEINPDGKILIAANAVNGTKGAIGTGYLSQIVMQQTTADMASINGHIATLNLYNPYQNYKLFMIPALIGILIMMLCGFLPALNIVGEKEAGTIEQINVTPVSKLEFILAKLIPYWLIGMIVLTIVLLLSWLIYGISSEGNLLLVYLLAILLAFVFSAIGLIVSNYSNTMQQGMLVMWFIVVLLILMSGLFTPVRSMPYWAQHTTILNPMHYFIDAVRTVFIRGGGISSISPQLLALTGFAITLGSMAVWSYKKNKA